MPAGDPGVLEELAARLDAAARGSADLGAGTRQVTASIRSAADWTGDAADAYTAFTGDLSRGAAAAAPPLARIAAAIGDYAGYLRAAQQNVAAAASAAQAAQVSGNDIGYVTAAEAASQQAVAAVSAWQAAGDRAAGEVSAAAGELGSLFGARGPVGAWLDRQHVRWDSLAGLPGLGDPAGPEILKTPGWELAPQILKTPGADLGPEILLTPPGELGPEVLLTPPGDLSPQTLKTPPGLLGSLINYSEEGDEKVSDVLKGKLGSITRAPLPRGSPSWSDIGNMTMNEIRAAARTNQPGFKTILKLLTDGRFNRP